MTDIDAVVSGDCKDLRHADLRDATLRHADLPAFERVPETGSFTAFKGCLGHVVKLSVPDDADRASSLKGPKCRVSEARVLEVLGPGGEACDETAAESWYDGTGYREGEMVLPDDWDDDPRAECTHGIHIYPTLREAIEAVR